MKLVTFQTIDALKSLINNGELICDEKYIDIKKMGITYKWVIEKMNEKIKGDSNYKYPIWCWVKCYNGICPPKVKGEQVEEFQVKITFNKKEEEVFITDFRRYSFLLNNAYIPNTIEEKEKFDEKIKKLKITKNELKMYVRPDQYINHRTDKKYIEICEEIKETFDRCITKDSNILQGCIWNIKLAEVEKIEFIPKDEYRYGSLNYKRKNGNRIDWKDDFYKILKRKVNYV